MHYVILSNNGPWDISTAGVVGLCEASDTRTLHNFIVYCTTDSAETFDYYYTNGNELMLAELLQEGGIDILTLGGVVAFAVERVEQELYPICYFVVDLKQKG